MKNSFNFTLPKKHFIFPSILNDSFAGQSNLGCRSLLLTTWSTSSMSLIACKVSFEKSADILIGTPLRVTVCFSLAAFRVLSLFLTFVILIMMCHGVILFGSNLFGTLCAFCTCMTISYAKLGKLLFHYFFK